MAQPCFDDLKAALQRAWDDQPGQVEQWHQADPGPAEKNPAENDPAGPDLARLAELARQEHLVNFRLWHVEDEARRTDVGPEAIAECKRRIDRLNQARNDLIEEVDACLVALLTPLAPPDAALRFNTETVGAALDRLSILALKAFHMAEQAGRAEAGQAHRRTCQDRLDVILAQRQDLARSVAELMDDYVAGQRRPRVYRQFKMYNDPRLNPRLYGQGAKGEE